MIERIVAAILDTPDAAGGTLRQVFRVMGACDKAEPTLEIVARGVLTALREPSPQVLKAGEIADFDQGTTLGVWQSMIDAILTEEPK